MKFPRTSGGTWPGARRRCKCSRKSCQTTIFQVLEVAYSAGAAEGVSVFELCLRLEALPRGVSLNESGWSDSSCAKDNLVTGLKYGSIYVYKQ